MRARTALVTGGTGDIGSAIVRGLAASGAEVSFVYRAAETRARRLADEAGAVALRGDLTQSWLPPTATFDILVNCAGINPVKLPAAEVPTAILEETYRLNVEAPLRLVQACLPWMVEQRWGRIVNISSVWAFRASPLNLAYTVSKHALSGITRTVAREYGRHGVTSNEVCPGPVESRLLQRAGRIQQRTSGVSGRAWVTRLRASTPSGRLATPEDVAHAVWFLTSDLAGQINGVSIPVDGGLTT